MIKRQARWVRWIAVSSVAYLVAGLLGGPVAAAAELSLAKLKNPDPVPVASVKKHRISRPDQTAAHLWKGTPRSSWPKPGTATVTVPAHGSTKTKAGTLPLRVAPHQGKAGKKA
ncbi:hypothetical protein [Streptomyces viridochromogenes]|uniref:hypothetical protein n=1 Tax=Streptomyces viridochromogenes TaxID=1938 RepID=UPI000567E2F3|nr:hypothetical protein [Streptomyces viridochromogenes]